MKRIILTALAFTALSIGAASADPVGVWRTGDGSATVRISKCGGGLCGFVASTSGSAGKDIRNPDPAKRSRSVLGIEVLSLRPRGAGTWGGTSYNAEDGLTYNATLTEAGARSLQIKGCGANGGVCGSENWSRVR